MSKREVVKDLEYWARLAGAYAERRRIRRAIARAMRNLEFVYDLHGIGYVNSAIATIDRATKGPKRKAARGPR